MVSKDWHVCWHCEDEATKGGWGLARVGGRGRRELSG